MTINHRNVIASIFLLLTQPIAWAQQNLFNVPSSDITQENQIFMQQQFNFASDGFSNTTLDYGLGDNWEIGVNLFNLGLYSPDDELGNPNLLLNFQKAIEFSEHYKLSFGSQSGFSLPLHQAGIGIPSFSYISNAIDLEDNGKYYLGAYYANHTYAGSNASGLMIGTEYPLLNEQVHFMADLLTGNSSLSLAVVGLVFFLPRNWQLSFGGQLPAPGSQNNYGLVFEITKL